MRPTIVRPPHHADPTQAACWAFYGATQALEMLGLTYDVAPAGPLCLDPLAGSIAVRREASRTESGATAELVRTCHVLTPTPDDTGLLAGCPASLPVLGPLRRLGPGRTSGLVQSDGGAADVPFLSVEADDAGGAVRFNGCFFATLGLYLSRFSWAGNPGFDGFVRHVDDLWDVLAPRWGGCAVVNAYLEIIANALAWAYERLGLHLTTVWPHPVREGRIMRHGLICSHDVDATYADPAFRAPGADQTGNVWFNFPRWRDLETRLGVKSAFYLMAPNPRDSYWFVPSYSLADPVVREAALALRRDGWEISIHQLSHDDPAAVAGEAEFFREVTGQPVTGTRSHYLKHAPASLRYKQEAGHLYDSTWYAETTDSSFLCGAVLPFRPLDCERGEALDIIELPFVIEDGIVTGCYGDAGTARSIEEAVADGLRAAQQALSYDGYVCTNWHQRVFARMTRYPGTPDDWTPAWAGIVEGIKQRSPALWTPLPIELARFWARRRRVSVEAVPAGCVVRNAGEEDVADMALCVHRTASEGECAGDLGRQGNRARRGIPLSVGRGEEQSIAV